MFSVLRARGAAGAVAGASIAASSSSPAQALAPIAPGAHQSISFSKCDDEDWIITDRNSQTGDVILFRPFSEAELKSTTNEVISMLQSSHEAAEASMAKTGSGSTSPGESVDEVLDATTLVPPSPSSASTPFNVDASTLSLRLSTINSFSQSIASNPLIQAEMARMFLKDEKLVHELLSQGVDLDDLTRACFINPSGFIPGSSSLKLLPPIAQDQSTQGGAQDRRVDEEEGNEEDRQPLHHHVLEVVKVALEATGGAFQWLGGWIKDRAQEVFGTQNDAQDHHRTEGVEELDTNQARQTRAGGGAGSKILDISLIVLSIVFVLLILRRPLASFRIVRAAI